MCTSVWVRDLDNYRYPVEKIGECPTQYGKKDPSSNTMEKHYINVNSKVSYETHRKIDEKKVFESSNDKLPNNLEKDSGDPYSSKGFWSTIFFWWVMPIIKKGRRQPLIPSDIYPVPHFLSSERLGNHLRAIQLNQVLLLRTTQPLLLGALLDYLSNNTEYFKMEGYMIVGSLCCSWILIAIFVHPNFYISMKVALKIKVALGALIYRKVLKLSHESLNKTSVGQIINILSNDLQKFDLAIMYIHYVWIAPLQLLIVGWILWIKVGKIGIIGLSVFVVYVPLQSYIGRIFAKLSLQLAFVTDERSQLMNEIITGIKVIKMHTWESPFAQVVSKIRMDCQIRPNLLEKVAGPPGRQDFIVTRPTEELLAPGVRAGRRNKRKEIFVFKYENAFQRQIRGVAKYFFKFHSSKDGPPVLMNINLKAVQGDLFMIVGPIGSGKDIPYAKSAGLYLQQMETLDQTMPVCGYKLFSEKEYFTIRRRDSFWGGSFSDQTIEQFMMRMLKISGGVTRGWGITDSTLPKWFHALPRCVPICDALEQFTGVRTGTSEQLNDMRISNQSRYNKDRGIFVAWFQVHPQFVGYDTDRLVSLSTGIVADTSVNCDNAVELGLKAASEMAGKSLQK
ncbi:Multidrug resistance-associated protein 4 [Nymphon striatum]|nr:Multidrug resistance-associated protein 4 [Nymphon striatum]